LSGFTKKQLINIANAYLSRLPSVTSNLNLPYVPIDENKTVQNVKAKDQPLPFMMKRGDREVEVPLRATSLEHMHTLGGVIRHFFGAMTFTCFVLDYDEQITQRFQKHFLVKTGSSMSYGKFERNASHGGKRYFTQGGRAGNLIEICNNLDPEHLFPDNVLCKPEEYERNKLVKEAFIALFRVLQWLCLELNERNRNKCAENVGLVSMLLHVYGEGYITLMGSSYMQPYDWSFVMSLHYYLDVAVRRGMSFERFLSARANEANHSKVIRMLTKLHGATSYSPSETQCASLKAVLHHISLENLFFAKTEMYKKRMLASEVQRLKSMPTPPTIPFAEPNPTGVDLVIGDNEALGEGVRRMICLID
jgi:hypothetical protein